MRLIDADKLYEYIDDKEYTCDKYAEVEDILEIIKNQPTIKTVSFEALEKIRREIQERATIAMNERYKQGLRTALEIIDKLIKKYESEGK